VSGWEATEFAFGSWSTPVDNAATDLLGAEFSGNGALSFRVRVYETGATCRLIFEDISAFRVLDEHGLLEIWQETRRQGCWPGDTTFRVRNHGWRKESSVSLATTSGWSYVAASDDYFIEVVSAVAPTIIAEKRTGEEI